MRCFSVLLAEKESVGFIFRDGSGQRWAELSQHALCTCVYVLPGFPYGSDRSVHITALQVSILSPHFFFFLQNVLKTISGPV